MGLNLVHNGGEAMQVYANLSKQKMKNKKKNIKSIVRVL